MKWEYFDDVCYYNLWCVRPEQHKEFGHPLSFHVMSEKEAKSLCEHLNLLEYKLESMYTIINQ